MKHRKIKNSELDRKDIDGFKAAAKTPLIIILDNIRSLNNIGSVFRTADAFLVEKIYLCGMTAQPPHKDIQKTALGATESVSWEYTEDTLELAADAIMLDAFKPEPNQKYAIIFGNEVKGVQQSVVSVSDVVLEIPQYGTKHSLNISVSTGIVVWDFFSKLKIKS